MKYDKNEYNKYQLAAKNEIYDVTDERFNTALEAHIIKHKLVLMAVSRKIHNIYVITIPAAFLVKQYV